MNEKPNSLGGGALHPRMNRKASSSRGASFNLDSFIDMVNDHDCQVANVDMAIQTQWFDDGVIFKLFSEIDNENTLEMISKKLLAYYNYYLSCEDFHIGTENDEGVFTPHCADFSKRLKQIKQRMMAQRAAWLNVNAIDNELFDYLQQEVAQPSEKQSEHEINHFGSHEVCVQMPVNLRKMICLNENQHINDFAKTIREDICVWIKEKKSQYWDIVYLELLNLGLIKIGTTRRDFSRLVESLTSIKQSTIYNNMVKSYSHGKTIDWYKKQPDSSTIHLIGVEIREIFTSITKVQM
jgi:hypothetical protein